jgi:hypothetical protein
MVISPAGPARGGPFLLGWFFCHALGLEREQLDAIAGQLSSHKVLILSAVPAEFMLPESIKSPDRTLGGRFSRTGERLPMNDMLTVVLRFENYSNQGRRSRRTSSADNDRQSIRQERVSGK